MKILFIYISISLFLVSCATKYVSDDQLLLIKNQIIIDSVANNSEKLREYLVQRPNFKALGVPFSLYFYNLADLKAPVDVVGWRTLHHKLYNDVSKSFSEKQAVSMAKSMINLNNWFIKNGEPPSILDDRKLKRSQDNLQKYFKNKGFFNAGVTYKKDTIRKKKAKVSYFVTKGNPTILDSISSEISSRVVDSLYRINIDQTYLKSGLQYDNELFNNEVKRLTYLLRNKGVYHFDRSAVEFKVDTVSKRHKAQVTTVIKDRVLDDDGVFVSKSYQMQKITKVNVYTDFHFTRRFKSFKVHQVYEGVNFFAYDELRFKPKHLMASIFIKPGDVYSDEAVKLTRLHLRSLKNFSIAKINFKEVSSKALEANIYLTSQASYTSAFSTELARSNVRIYDVSAKFSFINKNLFRGGELFKISGFGSYFKTAKDYGWELGTDLSLEVPRFMVLFGLDRLVPKRMYPKTRFYVGSSIQKNIGLDRKIYNFGIDYKWRYNSRKFMQLELLSTQYINNFNQNQYFNIYRSELNKVFIAAYNTKTSFEVSDAGIVDYIDKAIRNDGLYRDHPSDYQALLNVWNRRNIVTSDFLIPVISYSFTYNNQQNFRDTSFSFFKVRVSNSGNIIGYILNQENKFDKKTLFNIPIAQYFKTDLEYKKFWDVSRVGVLGFRGFAGCILPYNGSDIPFSKSYFAGGSNDIRAWRTYDLGPGGRSQGLEYNIGNLKLLSNLEYRFNIIGSFKGALFIDTGNIFNISKSSIIDSNLKIELVKSLTNIAIGSGFGLRYDLKFLVARLDLGFKVREPYLQGNKWFKNFGFPQAQYNIGINYPF